MFPFLKLDGESWSSQFKVENNYITFYKLYNPGSGNNKTFCLKTMVRFCSKLYSYVQTLLKLWISRHDIAESIQSKAGDFSVISVKKENQYIKFQPHNKTDRTFNTW